MTRAGLSSVAAWAVILGCVASSFLLGSSGHDEDSETAISEVEGAEAPDTEGEWVGMQTMLMGRVVLMLEALDSFSPGSGAMAIQQQLEPMIASGDPIDNMCAAVLLARTRSYDRAREAAKAAVDHAAADTSSHGPPTLALAERVQRVIDSLNAESRGSLDISAEDREMIEGRLGWMGQLLMSTARNNAEFEESIAGLPLRVGGAFLLFFLIAGIAGLGGTIWGVVLIVRAAKGTLALHLNTRGGIGSDLPWIFAVWFVLMLGVSVVAGLIVEREERLGGVSGTILQLAVMVLPLLALAWPVVRGRAWADVRRELGLHSGKGIWKEVAYGFTVYATAIPLLLGGVLIAMIASALAGGGIEQASHPIQQAMAEGDVPQRLMLYLIAAVFAPIIEEILFRGVLYRHLRDLTHRWGAPASIFAGAALSSLIFAAIHPQGVFFIPILGALAVAFCLGREMRGSLIAPMVAHGFNNALVLSLGLAISA